MVIREPSNGNKPLIISLPLLFIVLSLDCFVWYDWSTKQSFFINPLLILFYNVTAIILVGVVLHLRRKYRPNRQVMSGENLPSAVFRTKKP